MPNYESKPDYLHDYSVKIVDPIDEYDKNVLKDLAIKHIKYMRNSDNRINSKEERNALTVQNSSLEKLGFNIQFNSLEYRNYKNNMEIEEGEINNGILLSLTHPSTGDNSGIIKYNNRRGYYENGKEELFNINMTIPPSPDESSLVGEVKTTDINKIKPYLFTFVPKDSDGGWPIIERE